MDNEGEFKLNRYSYGNLKAIKAAFKNLDRLEQQALYSSDEASLTIKMDLETILSKNSKVLTPKQMEVVRLVLIEDKTEAMVGELLGISQQSVHYRLKGALLRIREYLLSGKVRKDLRLSLNQNRTLLNMFSDGETDKDIAIALGVPLRRVHNKINVLRRKGKIGKRGDKVGHN